jgi:hypothetical protein
MTAPAPMLAPRRNVVERNSKGWRLRGMMSLVKVA